MLLEYAVEPKAIGSNWQDFRYLIEKFGFDRGRLISQFPKNWVREVYEASEDFNTIERARLVESLNRAKQSKLLRSRRTYDPLSEWMANALAQQGVTPFRAIIAQANAHNHASVVVASELDEGEALMDSPQTWPVPRIGSAMADAVSPLLISARTILFVDRFFNVRDPRYKETLKACLDVVHSSGSRSARCEIHYCDHESRPPFEVLERDAPRWLRGVIPAGMSVVLYAWNEKDGGEDFHARNLLTDIGGVSVEAGFSAEGAHQSVQIGLLASDFTQRQLVVFARASTVYDLAQPVLEISADGTANRI